MALLEALLIWVGLFSTLSFLFFVYAHVLGIVTEKLRQKAIHEAIEKEQEDMEAGMESEVKSLAGMKSVQAKDLRRAQKTLNQVLAGAGAPGINELLKFATPEQYSDLLDNPASMQAIAMAQPLIESIIGKLSNAVENFGNNDGKDNIPGVPKKLNYR